jgi:F0F1-type ATP synthase membrane subunit b/b'
MRHWQHRITIAVVLFMLTAATACAGQEPIVRMLEEMDRELLSYHTLLKEAGEAELSRRLDEFQAQLDKEYEAFFAQIEQEGQEYAASLQEEYGPQMLRLQLELLLLTLDDEEELERAEAMAALQQAMEDALAEKEAELHRRLADFEQSLEERFAQFQLEVGQEIEEKLAEEYSAFKADFLWAFEHSLRNSFVNR